MDVYLRDLVTEQLLAFLAASGAHLQAEARARSVRFRQSALTLELLSEDPERVRENLTGVAMTLAEIAEALPPVSLG